MTNPITKSLNKVRSLPEHRRSAVVNFAAGGITLIILAVWSIHFIQDAKSQLAASSLTEYPAITETKNGPLTNVGEQFSSLYEQMSGGFSQIFGDEATTTLEASEGMEMAR